MNDLKCFFTCIKRQMLNRSDNIPCNSNNAVSGLPLSGIAIPVDSIPIVEIISKIVIIFFMLLFFITNRSVDLRFKKIYMICVL